MQTGPVGRARARVDSAPIDSTRGDSARIDGTRGDSARIDSTRGDSARIDGARVQPGPRPTVAGWGAAALVLVVAAAVDPWGFRPYTSLRWALVGLTVSVAAVAALVGAGGGRRDEAPEVRSGPLAPLAPLAPGAAAARPVPPAGTARPVLRVPRVVVVGAAVLGVCLTIATVAALDPVVALLGHPRRHLGLLGWAVAAVAFVVGTRLTGADIRRLLGPVAVVAAAVTGIAGLADLAGWDPFGDRFADGRIGGLLGQPVYLAAVAVLLAPVAMGVALDRSAGRRWRWAAAVGALTTLVALVGTETRGAWLGGALALAVAWPRLGPRLRAWGRAAPRPAAMGVTLAGSVLAAALLVLVGGRLLAALDPDAAGGRSRVDDWVVAARVVAAHPLTGVGPEGYRIAAPAHVDDGYARRHGRDEVIDRAHSAPLDVAVAAGIPAGAAYLVVVGAVVVSAARVVRRSSDPVVAGAAAGVVAWVGQQVTGFPIAEVDPLGWLAAGVVVSAGCGLAAGSPTGRRRGRAGRAAPDRPKLAPGAPRALAAGGAALATLAVAAGGWTGVLADRDLRSAERALAARDPAGAVAAADRATERRPDDVDAWYVAAQVAAAPAGLPAVDAGLDRIEAGLGTSPDDPALLALHTDLLVERALRSGLPDDLAAAEGAAVARTRADPAGPRAHRQLGMVLEASGRIGEARTALTRALALDPGDRIAEQALAAIGDRSDDRNGDRNGERPIASGAAAAAGASAAEEAEEAER